MYREFTDIQPYRTSPNEINKNAIVERMIETLKQYLLDLLMTYKIRDLYDEYFKYLSTYKIDLDFTGYLLELVCEINNNKVHRTIKAVPSQVFQELDKNKQKIVKRDYPLYEKDTIVIKRPERAGEVPLKLFNFDPEPYIIADTRGRKYSLGKLIDNVEGKLQPSTKFINHMKIELS
jgi:hypothetical protein